MLETIKAAAVWLSANLDPSVPRALFVVAVLLSVLVIRKLFPRSWEAFASVVPVPVIDPHPVLLVLSKAWQALPGTLIGAGLAALGAGGDIRHEVKGAAFGALAALAHEVLKAVPWVPYQGAIGKTKLPTLPILCLLGIMGSASLHPLLLGCSPAQQRAASADVVAKAEALAFNGATVALLMLDDQLARHLDSLAHPTEQQLAAAQLRVERLGRARDALVIVRKALAGELGDLDERGKLREAGKAVDLVAAELEADGVQLPDELQRALASARAVL